MTPSFIFPMAGASSRFSKAGYTQKKFMLDLFGRPVFDAVLNGFRRYFPTGDFVFVTQSIAEDEGAFVLARCKALGLPDGAVRVVNLPSPTSGQAETVARGLAGVEIASDTPITIFNIDTIRHDFAFPGFLQTQPTAGYLEVFKGEGTHWSFVELGSDALALRVTEKQRISDLCSTGLYHFAAAGLFLEAYGIAAKAPVASLQGGERYVAPLYNHLIAKGLPVRTDLIAADQVTFCGTPDEYEHVRRSWDNKTYRKKTLL